jgi:hypothetical protein
MSSLLLAIGATGLVAERTAASRFDDRHTVGPHSALNQSWAVGEWRPQG